MMESPLAVFFITCFFCCAFVTSDSVSTLSFHVPRDQVEILLALKNEIPYANCDLIWKLDYLDVEHPKADISSWTKDANSFDGVFFDNETGVVTGLNLHHQCLTSLKANSSLFRFHHLRYLRLSENLFDSSPIPAGLDRFTNLDFLDLTKSGFIGQVPSSISNLSRLTFLDLSYNKLTGRIPNLQNLTLLTIINLSHNKFTGRIPNLLHNLTLLTGISLSYNHFSESIPSYLFTMSSLRSLYLSHNHLTDPLLNINSTPTSKLHYLDIANNLLSFQILEPISKLPDLTYLDLSFQNITYPINFDLCPCKSLETLGLSGNSVSRLSTCSTTLSRLYLSSCNITEFPMFIKTQRNLVELDISKNRLKGKVPQWLWNLSSMDRLNLSHNSFSILEVSPNVLLNSSILELDLSSNAFQGSFPTLPPNMSVMAASNNNFTGAIPLTICKASELGLLDLSNNNFSGSIPRCLKNLLSLQALKLRNNNLSGRLPDMNNGLSQLDVGHNQISGKLPRSLVNTILQFLNVENNRITDTFPFWMKDMRLEVIVLRSNRFHGPISSPENPLPFRALRIIDISHNNFSGSLLPNYFANWSAPLVTIPPVSHGSEYTGGWHSVPVALWLYPSIYLRIKGRNTEFEKIQDIYTAIDFSGNRFEGQIPESIGHLKSLIALDLSNNNFIGHVPSSLAKLKQLESLDLSQNQLTERIPQELSVLTFLEYINMSQNRLTGTIPQSTQIGGQDKSCFEGNLNLCGLPLQKSCFKVNGAPSTHEPELPKREPMLNWKAAAIAYGPGVLIGLAIGQAFASYKPVLFYKLFRL